MGTQNWGIRFPPLFWHYPQFLYKREIKISKFFKTLWILFLHGILILQSSIFNIVTRPMNIYQSYGSIPEKFDLPIQYADLRDL
jgi:hypothetical protein